MCIRDSMHTNLDLFLDDGVGLFISMNSDGKAGSPRFIREGLLRRFADRYFPAPLEGTPIDARTAREHARMLAGTYASSRGFETNFLHICLLYTSPSPRDTQASRMPSSA